MTVATKTKKQTKVARSAAPSRHAAIEEAVSDLNTWADADSTALYDEHLHEGVGRLMLWMHERAPSAIDPFSIALA